MGVLTEGLIGLGQLDTALVTVDKALTRAERGGEHYSMPELLRIKGDVLLQQEGNAPQSAAEDCFLDAIAAAREQGALFWELRAALRLARLRTHQNRQNEAKQILEPVYDQFTEGFEAEVLKQAKSLLERLALAD
jgi:predicted ATPase